MSAPIAYGIDFGTTNSLISVAYPDRVDLVPLGQEPGGELMRSVVFLHRDNLRVAGEQGVKQYNFTASASTKCGACPLVDFIGGEPLSECRHAKLGGGCRDARLLTALKACLAYESPGSTHSWGMDFSWAELVAIILSSLKSQADRALGTEVRRAVIGHPVAFAGAEGVGFAEKQRLALDRLVEAARLSGFAEVVLLEEPAAALTAEKGEGYVVALDFGGGTFDVAVLEMGPDSGQALALQGVEIGGEDLDARLFEAKVADQLGVDGGGKPPLPAYIRKRLTRLGTALRLLEDPGALATVSEFQSMQTDQGEARALEQLENVLYGGFTYGLFGAIEQAKIALSSSDRASISFHRPGVEIEAPVTRAEFERFIEDDLSRIVDQIELALRQAGVSADNVDLVVRTGGSSSIPAFLDMLHELFGPEKVQTRPAYSTIAVGLGHYGQVCWS